MLGLLYVLLLSACSNEAASPPPVSVPVPVAVTLPKKACTASRAVALQVDDDVAGALSDFISANEQTRVTTAIAIERARMLVAQLEAENASLRAQLRALREQQVAAAISTLDAKVREPVQGEHHDEH